MSKAAAEAAAGEAGSLVNSSVTAHNSNASAHPAIQNKFASYLPLAGGTMTGVINRNGALVQNTVSGGSVSLIASHTGATEKGAALYLWDEANSTYPGYFILRAGHTSGYSDLRGTAPGGLTWKGYDVLRSYFTKAANTESIQLFSGPDYLKGGYLKLSGKAYTDNPGGFRIGASNGTTAHELKGMPDGQLTWDGKTILNEGRDAPITTWQSSDKRSWYRKYASGWIEQGGYVAADASSVTYPVAFADLNYCILRTRHTTNGNEVGDDGQNVKSYTTTGFTMSNGYAPSNGSWWFACGYSANS